MPGSWTIALAGRPLDRLITLPATHTPRLSSTSAWTGPSPCGSPTGLVTLT